jgi:hypothetical protein
MESYMVKGLRTWKTTPKYSGNRRKTFADFRRLPEVVKSAFLLPQMQFILKGKFPSHVNANMLLFVGRESSVGIATRYGLDGPGIEARCWRNFPHTSRPALGRT